MIRTMKLAEESFKGVSDLISRFLDFPSASRLFDLSASFSPHVSRTAADSPLLSRCAFLG